MNFNAGDIVWCIDPNNNNGKYTITRYHRKCVVVVSYDGFMKVRCLDREEGESEYLLRLNWNVEKKYFAHVQQKAVIL